MQGYVRIVSSVVVTNEGRRVPSIVLAEVRSRAAVGGWMG